MKEKEEQREKAAGEGERSVEGEERRNDFPLLLIHGEVDSTVPYTQSIDFHRAINEVKGFHSEVEVMRGEDHASPLIEVMKRTRTGREMGRRVREFVLRKRGGETMMKAKL